MVQTNRYARSMEGLITKAAYTVTVINPKERGVYEKLNSGEWKI